MTSVKINYPFFIIQAIWSSCVYPSIFPLESQLCLKKNFPTSHWFSCLQLSSPYTQKSITKLSSYGEIVSIMCFRKDNAKWLDLLFLLLIGSSVFEYSIFVFFRSAEFATNLHSISVLSLITSLNVPYNFVSWIKCYTVQSSLKKSIKSPRWISQLQNMDFKLSQSNFTISN